MFRKLFRRKPKTETRCIAHGDGVSTIHINTLGGVEIVDNIKEIHDSGDLLLFFGQGSAIVSKTHFVKASVQ